MVSMELLKFEKVVVFRGLNRILDGIDLEINSGEVLVLSGPNGCGKSTLLETAAGLLKLQEGVVSHNSAQNNLGVLREHTGKWKKQQMFGLTLQQDGMCVDLTVKEHLHFISKAYGINVSGEEIDTVFSEWGLAHRVADKISSLSGGLRRRLAVLSGLWPAMNSNTPILTILDEPSEGLDNSGVNTLISEINRLKNAEHSFLISTHDERCISLATSNGVWSEKNEFIITSKSDNQNDDINEEIKDNIDLKNSTDTFLEMSAMLDLRTWRTVSTRGVAAALTLLLIMALDPPAMSMNSERWIAGLILLPGVVAALMPPVQLTWFREERAGDWWRALKGGGLTQKTINYAEITMVPLAFIFTLLGPFAITKLIGNTVMPTGWIILYCVASIPFFAGATAALHSAINSLPRIQTGIPILLLLFVTYPFMIATDGLAMLITNPDSINTISWNSPISSLVLTIGILTIVSMSANILSEH